MSVYSTFVNKVKCLSKKKKGTVYWLLVGSEEEWEIQGNFLNSGMALAGIAQWLEHQPHALKGSRFDSHVWFPVNDMYLGCKFDTQSWSGHMW